MKKLITMLIAIAVTSGLQAQPSQGQIRLGGCVKFDSNSSEFTNGSTVKGPKSSHYEINPSAGYFLNNVWEVGLGLAIAGEKDESFSSSGNSSSEFTSTQFMVMPYAQYNSKINEKFYCTTRGMVDFGFGSYEDKFTGPSGTNTQKGDLSSIGVGISPGLEYFPSEKIGLNFRLGHIGYTSSTQKDDGGGKFTESDFGLKYSFKRVGVGASYLIGGTAD